MPSGTRVVVSFRITAISLSFTPSDSCGLVEFFANSADVGTSNLSVDVLRSALGTDGMIKARISAFKFATIAAPATARFCWSARSVLWDVSNAEFARLTLDCRSESAFATSVFCASSWSCASSNSPWISAINALRASSSAFRFA